MRSIERATASEEERAEVERGGRRRAPQWASRPWAVLRRAATIFREQECGLRAAALAYHGLLSLFPLLLFVLFIGSQFIATEQARSALNEYLEGALPARAEGLKLLVAQTLGVQRTLGLVGGLGLAWSASAVFNALTASMNAVWGAAPRSFWARRLLALGLVLGVGVLFLLSLGLGALASVVVPGLPAGLGRWLWRGLGVLVAVLLFWILFRSLPNRRVDRRAALGGALLAGLLWEAAKAAFGWYLGSGLQRYGLVYGSLASSISLILWTYLSSLILHVGAAFGAALEAELQNPS